MEPSPKRPRLPCAAKSSRTGEQCKNYAMHGSDVCHAHGGRAKQVRKKATERVAFSAMRRMVANAGVDLDPIEHLLDSLTRTAQLVAVYGAMVADIDNAAEVDLKDRPGGLRGEVWWEVIDTGLFRTDGDGKPLLDGDGNLIPIQRRVPKADRLLVFNKDGLATLHPYVIEYHRLNETRAKLAKLALDAGVAERRVKIVEQQVEMTQQALEAALEDLGLTREQRQEARQGFARHLRAVE